MKKQIGLRGILREAGPYPYAIKAVICPDRVQCNVLNPWAVVEFIRIEALLRSATVHMLYKSRAKRKTETGDDELAGKYGVWGGWKTIHGFHHYLLSKESLREELARFAGDEDPSEDPIDMENIGITDILAEFSKNSLSAETMADHFRDLMLMDAKEPTEPFLWLRIDRNFPKKLIFNCITKRLSKIRTNIHIECPWIPYRTYGGKRPFVYGHRGLSTWLAYFRCYDHMRLNSRASFGDAGRAIYGSQLASKSIKTYERAEQAVKRVQRLILAAEQKNWPPPPIR